MLMATGMVAVVVVIGTVLLNRGSISATASPSALGDFLSSLTTRDCGGWVGPQPQQACAYRNFRVETLEAEDRLGIRFASIDIFKDSITAYGEVNVPRPDRCKGTGVCMRGSGELPTLWNFEMFLANLVFTINTEWNSSCRKLFSRSSLDLSHNRDIRAIVQVSEGTLCPNSEGLIIDFQTQIESATLPPGLPQEMLDKGVCESGISAGICHLGRRHHKLLVKMNSPSS
jgi:hypothetical protein